jgi:branched-chain amino acid transport system permease protein
MVGILVGIPSLKVKGLYLAIATIAASVILALPLPRTGRR